MTPRRLVGWGAALSALCGGASAQLALVALTTLSAADQCGEDIKSCVATAKLNLLEEQGELFSAEVFASGLLKYRRCVIDARNNNNEFIDGHICAISVGGRSFVRRDPAALAQTCPQGSLATASGIRFQLPYGVAESYSIALQRVDLMLNAEGTETSSCAVQHLTKKNGETVNIRGYPSLQRAPNDTAIALARGVERFQSIAELKTDECWTYAMDKEPVDLVGKVKLEKNKKKHTRAIKISLDDNSIETILAKKLRYFDIVDTSLCNDQEEAIGMQLMFGSPDVHFSGVIGRLGGVAALVVSLVSVIGSVGA